MRTKTLTRGCYLRRNALLAAEDKSITIASIGETTNLQELLRNDSALVRQKVKRIVYMDGDCKCVN